MKTLYRNTVLVFSLMIFAACPEMNDQGSFTFYNNSSHDVYVHLGLAPRELGGSLYPDTMLTSTKVGMFLKSERKWVYNYNKVSGADTLCFFIFDADTFNTYSWDEIKSEYKVLQRYDLEVTTEAMRKLKFTITYPPTEEMKDINMFPPYLQMEKMSLE